MYLLVPNLLVGVGITSTPASAGDATRFVDYDPGPQWLGPIGASTLDIDFGAAPPPVSAWGVVHHNLAGGIVEVRSGATFPPTAVQDSVDPAGATLLRRFATVTARYWRIALPVLPGGVAPLIGELLLGGPAAIADAPSLPTGYPTTVGNVARDMSPAGIPSTTKRGPPRVRLALEWAGMLLSDVTTMRAAYAACNEGANPLLIEDASGDVRYMFWTDPEFAPEALGNDLFHVRATFEEFPV